MRRAAAGSRSHQRPQRVFLVVIVVVLRPAFVVVGIDVAARAGFGLVVIVIVVIVVDRRDGLRRVIVGQAEGSGHVIGIGIECVRGKRGTTDAGCNEST